MPPNANATPASGRQAASRLDCHPSTDLDIELIKPDTNTGGNRRRRDNTSIVPLTAGRRAPSWLAVTAGAGSSGLEPIPAMSTSTSTGAERGDADGDCAEAADQVHSSERGVGCPWRAASIDSERYAATDTDTDSDRDASTGPGSRGAHHGKVKSHGPNSWSGGDGDDDGDDEVYTSLNEVPSADKSSYYRRRQGEHLGTGAPPARDVDGARTAARPGGSAARGASWERESEETGNAAQDWTGYDDEGATVASASASASASGARASDNADDDSESTTGPGHSPWFARVYYLQHPSGDAQGASRTSTTAEADAEEGSSDGMSADARAKADWARVQDEILSEAVAMDAGERSSGSGSGAGAGAGSGARGVIRRPECPPIEAYMPRIEEEEHEDEDEDEDEGETIGVHGSGREWGRGPGRGRKTR